MFGLLLLPLLGNILDDEELIETLSSSKIMGTKIEEQVKQQEITAVQIAEVRQVYKSFSCKTSIALHAEQLPALFDA